MGPSALETYPVQSDPDGGEPVIHRTVEGVVIRRGTILFRVERKSARALTVVGRMVGEIEDRGVLLNGDETWIMNPEDVLFSRRENAVDEKIRQSRGDGS